MTTTDLAAIRIRVAEAMGWTNVRLPYGTELHDLYGNPPWLQSIDERVPIFGYQSWSATGQVLDEIERRGWGCEIGQPTWRGGVFYDCKIYFGEFGEDYVEDGNKCRHLAICLAFLAAHDRAKEQA